MNEWGIFQTNKELPFYRNKSLILTNDQTVEFNINSYFEGWNIDGAILPSNKSLNKFNLTKSREQNLTTIVEIPNPKDITFIYTFNQSNDKFIRISQDSKFKAWIESCEVMEN